MKETKVEDELYFCEIVDSDIYIYIIWLKKGECKGMFPKKGYCFDEMRLTFFSTWDAEAILEKSLGAKVLHVALLVVPS